MRRKAVSATILTLLIVSIFTVPLNIQPVKADGGTIYIRADGSVDPPTAPILNVGNVYYTFVANIYDEIVVQRSNIIIDGAGYTLQGSGSKEYGFVFSGKNSITIKNTYITEFNYGVYIHNSHNIILTGNTITTNRYGVWIYEGSSNNLISGNIVTNNYEGVSILYSPNNVLRNNNMVGNQYSFGVYSYEISEYVQDVDASNFVDGKPVYYWVNHQNMEVPSDAGYVALVNSYNITAKELEIENNGQGILLANTTNSQIKGNNITNNGFGVWIYYSSSNTLSGNTLTNNFGYGFRFWSSFNNIITENTVANTSSSGAGYGIWLGYSPDNKIFHNNFINNFRQVSTYESLNVWDDGYPSGGNYWGDYVGIDEMSGSDQDLPGSDGIGDTPYIINTNNRDRYPLMEPFENYFTPTLPPENRPPNLPIDLAQFRTDGTLLNVGATIYETSVVFKGSVSDPDGDKVKLQVELRRLDEYAGGFVESAGGFKESEFVESGSEATAYAYGLIGGDYHWRTRTVDEHGLASDWVDFGNNVILEADFTVSTVSKLRDTINRRLQQWVTYPSYLINLVPWINQEKYDEFYWAGIDYDCLKLNALIKARDSLESGNIGSAEKYLQMSETYWKISDLCFQAALAVYDQNLAEAEVQAREIEMLCQKAVVIGLYWNPTLAETVDYIYLALDWAIGRTLVGTEQATKDLIVELMVKKFFELRFEWFDDRTISDWAKNRVGKYLFPILANWIESEESQWAFSKIIKEVAIEIVDIPAERLIQYIIEEVKDTVNFEQLKIESPGELRIYDSRGGVTGLLDGEVRQEIQRSVYYDGTVIIFYPSDSYWYEVAGTDDGTYGLTVTFVEGGDVTTFTAIDIPTWANAIHQYTIDWSVFSQGKEGVTLQIDSNGDGTFEQTIASDSELTHDEFMLQTATTIDFDPDTLNLKSGGSAVTVYIELPEGYDVSQIDVSSIRLNGTVLALTKPTGIGDYDRDGIPDFMVKFKRAEVIELFNGKAIPGNYAVEVTGLVSGVTFKGTDMIRAISPAK